MKQLIQFKTLLFALVFPLIVIANPIPKGKYTEEKKLNKSFEVNANATLNIDNSYGNIDITTWNENRIEITVKITVEGDDKDKVKEKLDAITVDFSSSKSLVTAKTDIEKARSNSWFNWGRSTQLNFKIVYAVKLPITNNVDLSNDYGNINLDTLEGNATLDCDYGNISTKSLLSENNSIHFDYSEAYFEYINKGTINADYSTFTIDKTKTIEIDADYSKSKIDFAEAIIYNCDYGSLTINNANTIKGDGDYLTLRIGNLFKSLVLNADYGSLKVEALKASVTKVAIQSDYLKTTLGYDADVNFNFEITLSYASLRGDDDFTMIKKRVESNSKYYSGFYGSENSNTTIVIDSDFGSVTLTKN